MDSFYILIFMVLLLVFYCFVVKSVEGISPTDGSKPKKFKLPKFRITIVQSFYLLLDFPSNYVLFHGQ